MFNKLGSTCSWLSVPNPTLYSTGEFFDTIISVIPNPKALILTFTGIILGVEMYRYWSCAATKLEPDNGGI